MEDPNADQIAARDKSRRAILMLSRGRGPARIAMALVAAIAIALPVLLGEPKLALAGVGILLALGASDIAYNHGPDAARRVGHVVYLSALVSLGYAVFGIGIAPVITVYFTSVVLLGAAYILGAKAAMFWAVPSVALVVASVYAPVPPEREVSQAMTLVTRLGTLLTILAFAVSFRRAHDRQAAELERRAVTDHLTGLPNRIELDRALTEALERSERYERRGAVIFVDVDGMKKVNDSLGHGIGDAFLQEISSRMRSVTRGVDTPSRLGGDEFVVLLAEYEDPKGGEIYARKLLAELTRPWNVADQELRPSASIGIAPFPDAGTTAEELLRVADAAMYQAKQAGGRRIFVGDQHGLREVR